MMSGSMPPEETPEQPSEAVPPEPSPLEGRSIPIFVVEGRGVSAGGGWTIPIGLEGRSIPIFGLDVRTVQASEVSPSREKSLLETVLNETITKGQLLPGEIDLEPLLEVAKKYQEEPFGLEPVAVELVQAALGPKFKPHADSLEQWMEVSAQVAQVLFDDPIAHDRLEAFWCRLVESQR